MGKVIRKTQLLTAKTKREIEEINEHIENGQMIVAVTVDSVGEPCYIMVKKENVLVVGKDKANILGGIAEWLM